MEKMVNWSTVSQGGIYMCARKMTDIFGIVTLTRTDFLFSLMQRKCADQSTYFPHALWSSADSNEGVMHIPLTTYDRPHPSKVIVAAKAQLFWYYAAIRPNKLNVLHQEHLHIAIILWKCDSTKLNANFEFICKRRRTGNLGILQKNNVKFQGLSG